MSYYFLPSSLNLSSVFPYWGKPILSKAEYLVSLIIRKTYDMDAECYEKTSIPLYSQILSEYLTTSYYTIIINGLISEKIIFEIPACPHRHVSKRYGIHSRFLGDEIVVKKITDKPILKRLDRFMEGQRLLSEQITKKNWSEDDSHIENCLNKIVIEGDNAREFARQNYSKIKQNRAFGAISRVEDKAYSFSKPRSDGRLYYVLTSMPKEIRGFLRYEGKPLWEVDLKSFWPTCLLTLARGEERRKLAQLVQNDLFYEPFISHLIGKEIERDVVKKTFMKHVLFTKNPVMPDLKRRFNDEFPFLAMSLACIKEKEAGDLERYFSRLEASIVFPVARSLPFALTVHDAVVTTEDLIYEAYDRLVASASKVLKIEATVEKKPLGGWEASGIKKNI